MNKKRKGFTLTELIAVIVILGVLGLLGIPAYNTIRKQTLETQYENVVGLIETEASKYAAKKSVTLTNVQELIDEGLIETDDGYNVIDPRNNESMNCNLIEVTYQNGTYISELIESKECDLEEAKRDYSKIRILVEGLETGEIYTEIGNWIGEDVELSVVTTNLPSEDEITNYRWISGTGQISNDNTMKTSVTTILDTTINVEVTTNTNHKYFANATLKIDKEAPLIKKVEQSGGNDWTKGRDVIITATDQNGSGMSGYYVGTSQCTSETEFKTVDDPKGEVNIESIAIYEPTHYYVCVKDVVGNITRYPETILLQVEDINKPRCVWGGENTEWTNETREITLTCEDDESGCHPNYSSYSETFDVTTKTSQMSYTIKDNAGNETVCSKTVDVYVDKDNPTAPTTMNFVYEDWSVYEDNTWTKSNIYAGRAEGSPGPTGSTDVGSGVLKYQISSDGKNWEDFKYDNSKTMYKMSGSRTHTRYFRAVDQAGNVSETLTKTAKIDKMAPTCGTITGQSSTWTKNDRTLSQSCSDGTGSGCVKATYSKIYNTTTKTATMSTTISDNAGNTAECSSSVNVYVDKSGPTITFGTDGSTSYLTQASTTISASDDSGLNSLKYGWSTSSESTTANSSITSGKNVSSTCDYSDSGGNCYLYVYACDKVGNCNSKRSNFLIDRQKPTIEKVNVWTGSAAKTNCNNNNTKVCAKFRATDPQTSNLSELYFVRTHCWERNSTTDYQSCTYKDVDMSAVNRRDYFVANNENYLTFDMREIVANTLNNNLDNKTANTSLYTIASDGTFYISTSASSSLTVQYAFRVCDRRMNCTDADFKSK